jgi:hypothetical protein
VVVCLETRVIAAFVAGRLAAAEVPDIEAHVEACENCYGAVVRAAAATGTVGAGTVGIGTGTATGTATAIAAVGGLTDAYRKSAARAEPPAARVEKPRDKALAPTDKSRGLLPNLRLDFPDSVGPYWITGLLGRGGMGVVYRGQHESTGRSVAIKTVRVPSRAAFLGIRNEIAFLKAAHHPGIVTIVDHDLGGATPWYAMELLQGETLADRLNEVWHPRLAPPDSAPRPAATATPRAPSSHLRDILTLFARLCEPLEFIHRAGIVHCDLKPSNVFIGAGDQPVLMDFGLVANARGAIGREVLQGNRRLGGTLAYVSPEVIRGRIPDARADIYGLGCMLYEALTGQPPFSAATAEQLLELHLRATPRAPAELVFGLPEGLGDLVMRMLNKRPQDRLGHAQDVQRALIAAGALIDDTASLNPGQRAGYLFRPALVGRNEIVADVLTLCKRTQQGQGALVLIEGESGIGKTFFASELSQRALRRGLQVITGECTPPAPDADPSAETGGAPLHPFREFLEAVGDHCRVHGHDATARFLGGNLKLLTPYEPSLGHLPGAEALPDVVALPAAAARERLVQAMTDALAAFSAERPLLVTLDDLQWADGLTLSVLEAMDEEFLRKTPIVVLATARSDEPRSLVERVFGNPHVMRVRLERLDQTSVTAIVSEMLAMATPPPSLVKFVDTHSEGIPFFIAEYLRAVTAEGLLSRVDGRWQLAAGTDWHQAVSFPTTLTGLIQRRLGALSPPARAVIDAASVLGREFEATVLATMLASTAGTSSPTVTAAIDEAVSRQLVHATMDDRHRFLHDQIRENAYTSLDADTRSALHRAAARAIEDRHGKAAGFAERYGDLAHHWRAGGVAVAAIEYLERAGERALQLSADAQAAQYFREALALESTLIERWPAEGRARWERQLGDALQGQGQMAESAAPLLRAAALVGWRMPRRPAGLGFRVARSLMRQTLHRLLPGLTPRLTPWPRGRRSDSPEGGRIFDRLQRAYFYSGQEMPALLTSLTGLNLMERLVPSPELATAYGNTGAMVSILPAPDLAQAYFDRALRTLDRAPDPTVESYLRMLLGVQRLSSGRLAEAIAETERGLALATAAAHFRRLEECLAVRAAIEIVAGLHQRALPFVDRLVASATRRGDVHMTSWGLLQLAQCRALAGNFAEVLAVVARVQPLLPAVGRPERIWALSLEAHAALATGDLVAACAVADQAAPLVAAGPPVQSYCIDAYARLAEVRMELLRAHQGGPREAVHLASARRMSAVMTKVERVFPVAVPLARLHIGTFSWLQGNRGTAIDSWQQGLEAARQIGLGHEEARLTAALAASLPRTSARRRDLERQARELLAAQGLWSGPATVTIADAVSSHRIEIEGQRQRPA